MLSCFYHLIVALSCVYLPDHPLHIGVSVQLYAWAGSLCSLLGLGGIITVSTIRAEMEDEEARLKFTVLFRRILPLLMPSHIGSSSIRSSRQQSASYCSSYSWSHSTTKTSAALHTIPPGIRGILDTRLSRLSNSRRSSCGRPAIRRDAEQR